MCLALQQKKDYNQIEDAQVKNENCDIIQNLNHDILFHLTYYTKLVLSLLSSVNVKLQNTTFFKILTTTTQPAHVITIISAMILAKILTSIEKSNDISAPSIFLKLTYLISVAAHFGIQIWMTFVSGLALYLSVPRHTFGEVQKVLFPKYFMINAFLSLITLSTFLQIQDDVNKSENTQVIALVTSFCIELVIRLYLAPVLLELITKKNNMETAAGVGMEIGKYKAGSLKKCPVYNKLHRFFRKIHMTIAMGNMITMACTTFHLYYLSQRINI